MKSRYQARSPPQYNMIRFITCSCSCYFDHEHECRTYAYPGAQNDPNTILSAGICREIARDAIISV